MNVVLQYFEGCPHWRLADGRVREAIASSGRTDIELQLERVETEEDAARLEFRGSPTILVDGVDPFGSPAGEIGLSCRVYRDHGEPTPAPSVEELRAALVR